MRIVIKNLIVAILAILTVIGININPSKDLNFIESLSGNSINYIIMLFAFGYFIKRSLQTINKRKIIFSIIAGILFATFEIIGFTISQYGDFTGIFTKGILLKTGWRFVALAIVFYATSHFLFSYPKSQKQEKGRDETEIKKQEESKKEKCYSFFTNNKKSLLWIGIVIFLSWLPYFLRYYPGILGVDSMNQLEQARGVIGLSNHHPVYHTWILKIIITLGETLFGNITTGVATYSILQMIVMSFTFSYIIYYLAKKGIGNGIRTAILLFFILNPVFPLYSISFGKDVPFAIIMCWVTLLLFELVTNTQYFLKSKKYLVSSFLTILAMILIRNNGIYIFVLLIPFLFLFLRKKYLNISLYLGSALIISVLLTGPVLMALGIAKSSPVEMYSIPVQAITRMVNYNQAALTQQEKDEISLYMNYEAMLGNYNPNLSDPNKGNFKVDYYQEHKLGFIGFNIKLFLSHPMDYGKAFLCNTSRILVSRK